MIKGHKFLAEMIVIVPKSYDFMEKKKTNHICSTGFLVD